MNESELARFFDDLAAWARERSGHSETIAYGPHRDQVFDRRLPRLPGENALVLVLHGGFWRAPFSRSNTTALATALTEAGWATANVEYRRLGPGAYRPMLADVGAARRRLASFERAVAVGHSAGGHLALWLAAEGLVDAAVSLGGVCDLEAAARADLGKGAVVELLGGTSSEVPGAYLEADPAARLPLRAPQVLIHGTADDRVPIGHAQGYADRARDAGDDCRVVEIEADHFAPIDPRSKAFPTLLGVLASLPLSVATT